MFRSKDGAAATGPPPAHGPDGPRPAAAGLGVTLAFALLPVIAPAALAQNSISEITVIFGNSSTIQPPAGYTRIDVDLNQGAGGSFIYLCYKRGPGAPITDLAVTTGSAVAPPGFVQIPVDLNRGAGGAFIYLWYRRDPDCGTILNLAVQAMGSAGQVPAPNGYTRIGTDLNQGAGGAYIYLAFQKG